MSFPIKKWINNGLLILFILSILIIIPLPFNDEQDTEIRIKDEQWKFVCVKEGQGCSYYPKKSGIMGSSGFINIVSQPGSESYVESDVDLPDRASIFSYVIRINQLPTTTILFDSNNIPHVLTEKPPDENTRRSSYSREDLKEFDISQYAGQKVTIRLKSMSSPPGVNNGYYHHDYGRMRVINKPYTLWDNFNIFKNMLTSVLLVSILIGFLIGISGLEFFSRSVNRIQIYMHENKISGTSFENKYIRRFLKMSFRVLDVPMCAADKIGNVRLRTGMKITSVLFLSFTIIYVTYIVAYIVVMVALAIIILAIIIWIIIPSSGSSPSGGSIGGGGGSSGSSNSSSKAGYYEKDGKKCDIKTEERIIKQDGRTYRDGFFGWNADKDFFGDDEVERDFFGDPKIEQDFFGDQKIEKDFFGDPIVPPKKKK